MADERLSRLAEALRRTPGKHELGGPSTEAELDEVGRRLGRPLDAATRAVYRLTGPGQLVGGELQLHGLLPEGEDDEAVASASELLRGWDWPVPDELVIVGGNGAEEHYGVWLPPGGGTRPIAVEMGEIFEPGSFAVAGEDLVGLVLGRVAFHLALDASEGDEEAAAGLDALGLPSGLRGMPEGGSDEEHAAVLAWANPGLEGGPGDAYEDRLTAEDLARIAAG